MGTRKKEAIKKNDLAAEAQSCYLVSELASHSGRLFGENVRSECVTAAFKQAGKDYADLAEAKEIVEKFMKKEIK